MQKKPAIFLDRDGVLTEEKSYVCSLEELSIFPYAKECIKRIKEKGYYAIVITNQSGIARGLFTEEILQEINMYLIEEINVDAIYYCPHHTNGKIEKYRKKCNCRKPEVGMLEKAQKDFQIDMEKSYLVGDRASDILTGKKAGLKTILLESGYGTKRLEQNVKADYTFNDLRDIILVL